MFNEWTILGISPEIIDDSTKFCPVNAATKGGRMIGNGAEAFEEVFSERVEGKRIFVRNQNYPDNVPTNVQAEVLIYNKIPKENITSLIFPTEAIAEKECLRLELCGVNVSQYDIIVSSDLFEKKEIVRLLQSGKIPEEKVLKYKQYG
ncbi:DUF4433 domain-containing protein [Staphylococcus carnosus]|uniref:DarT ssDNA thymidine ADP-ribosyltransferase family protein n=1 Tax=Staphylococcus carnosus TaxID=1281 RepID=UPI0009E2F296|nr:DUF4433 domain-containing protein [Staphylococcus carnosus]